MTQDIEMVPSFSNESMIMGDFNYSCFSVVSKNVFSYANIKQIETEFLPT